MSLEEVRAAQDKRALEGQQLYRERWAQEYVVTETNRERCGPPENEYTEPFKPRNPESTHRTYYRM